MTTDSKVLHSMLNALQLADDAFKVNIDKFMGVCVKIANKSIDFQDELRLFGDIIFHLYLKDIDFNIWIMSSDGILAYNTSFYEPETQRKRTIHFILGKDILRRIFTKEMDAAEAYMKGFVEFDGSFSDAMIAKNLIKIYTHCLEYI
ncbi:MAG: hypothetical protein ACFFBH_12245 [Promethearchaeota archaeon]